MDNINTVIAKRMAQSIGSDSQNPGSTYLFDAPGEGPNRAPKIGVSRHDCGEPSKGESLSKTKISFERKARREDKFQK